VVDWKEEGAGKECTVCVEGVAMEGMVRDCRSSSSGVRGEYLEERRQFGSNTIDG
jgi:hypothetical protein